MIGKLREVAPRYSSSKNQMLEVLLAFLIFAFLTVCEGSHGSEEFLCNAVLIKWGKSNTWPATIHADCEKHFGELGDGLENVLDSLFS